MQIIEKQVSTILRPTSINLAPYVVNPYQGCIFGCVFCYARTSKVARQEKIPWGEYVKVKINAADVLKKEIGEKKPDAVLIGSTTDPFQSIEKKYRITRSILRVLNESKTKYVIMSRSLLIEKEMGFIDKELCQNIYFTVSMLPEEFKKELEPHTPNIEASIKMAGFLRKAGIKTTAYFCPVLPFFYDNLSKIGDVSSGLQAEFEILNFQMADMNRIIKILTKKFPRRAAKYKKMCRDRNFYDKAVVEIGEKIKNVSQDYLPKMKIHSHAYQDYFKNVY